LISEKKSKQYQKKNSQTSWRQWIPQAGLIGQKCLKTSREVKLKTLEMKLNAFLKDLKYSKSHEQEKDVNGIDAFRNVSLTNEEEEEDFML
jgi:Fe-S cluster biosynthesis and repair protein YggX